MDVDDTEVLAEKLSAMMRVDPGTVVAVEAVSRRAGLASLSRGMSESHPFLRTDRRSAR